MISFFKTLGLGLLYVVTLPLTLLALALGILFCIILFLVLAIKGVISFLRGKSLFAPLEEDVLAEKIFTAARVDNSSVTKQTTPTPRTEVDNYQEERRPDHEERFEYEEKASHSDEGGEE